GRSRSVSRRPWPRSWTGIRGTCRSRRCSSTYRTWPRAKAPARPRSRGARASEWAGLRVAGTVASTLQPRPPARQRKREVETRVRAAHGDALQAEGIGEVFRDSAADDGGRAVASGASGFHDAVVEVAVGVAERRHRGAREALERVLASGKLAKEVVVGEPGERVMLRPVRSDLDSGGVGLMDLARREERFSRGLRVPVVHAADLVRHDEDGGREFAGKKRRQRALQDA